MNSVSQQTTWTKNTFFALVALVTAVAPGSLVAQSVDDPDLSGNWRIERQPYSCGEWNLDQFGNVRAGCAISIDQLPLNKRARAWAEFYDEPTAQLRVFTVPVPEPMPADVPQRGSTSRR